MFDHLLGSPSTSRFHIKNASGQRVLDIAASGAGLVVLAPLLLILAALVKLQDGGPVLYSSKRVGRGGKLFSIHKFRSMVQGADRMGGGLTVRGDARVTRVGRFLRTWKLDELPQLMNVFKGEMSLVGARPENPAYVARYTPEQREILMYRPGITSPASLRYRNEEEMLGEEDTEALYVGKILPEKLALDLAYLRKRTVVSDVIVILRTIGGIA